MALKAVTGKCSLGFRINHCIKLCGLNTALEAVQSSYAIDDPLGLSQKDVSNVYTVSNKEVNDLYPRGLRKDFISLSETFRETGWLLRPQIYNILCQFKDNETPMSKKRYLLHGADGCGKTLASGQIVHWCWKAGWFIIHVPGAYPDLPSGKCISFWAHSRKEVRQSVHDSYMYDQPQEAATWLGSFKLINARHLKTMKLSEDRVWSRHESSEAGDDLMSLVDLGLQKPALATDIIAVLLKEVIKEHHRRSEATSPETENFQMLLSIDEFNSCYSPCAAAISKFEGLETRQLSLIKYFRDLVLPNEFPGPVVVSLTRRKLFKFLPLTTLPEDLLGQKAMMDVADYKHVEVNEFSRLESDNLLKYYKQKRWINREPFERVCEEVYHLSGGSPDEIYKLSQQL